MFILDFFLQNALEGQQLSLVTFLHCITDTQTQANTQEYIMTEEGSRGYTLHPMGASLLVVLPRGGCHDWVTIGGTRVNEGERQRVGANVEVAEGVGAAAGAGPLKVPTEGVDGSARGEWREWWWWCWGRVLDA